MKMRTRRFTLRDGMILVAAMGMGLSLFRFQPGEFYWGKLWRSSWIYQGRLDPEFMMVCFIEPMISFAFSATLAMLAMRLHRPRPAWRKVARQPGMIACLALVLGWAMGGIFLAAAFAWFPAFFRNWVKIEVVYLVLSVSGGFAVVIAWSSLALARAMRPERSWIDRLGRLLGLAGVTMLVLASYCALWIS